MYQSLALLAALGFLYALISGRVATSWLSGPILFVTAGFLLGPGAAGLLRLDIDAESLRLLAELTLAIVLFTDAANADLGRLRRAAGLPERLLLIGLPLTILLGFGVAWLLFPGLAPVELALLAAVLAPTDAALGAPVVSNPAVPADTRAALNIESGLNDGICVPVVLLLLGVAIGIEFEGLPALYVIRIVAEGLGIGLLTGVALSLAASWLLGRAEAAGWIGEDWNNVTVVALALTAFAAAQALGGSGFVACFTGGLAFRPPAGRRHRLLVAAEGTGDALALLTWVVFGAGVVHTFLDRITPAAFLYAVLSLTLIRMLPVWLSLAGSPVGTPGRLFIGWFGPRGLASIVFGILIIDADLPHEGILLATIVCTILLSVLAHGITATPLAGMIAGRAKRGRRSGPGD
ncbi:MAG: cation:proton antiporter [Rhodobacteraceae bacterium]|nr:cation:proton antiporter [Paracoccaceae bacterium]